MIKKRLSVILIIILLIITVCLPGITTASAGKSTAILGTEQSVQGSLDTSLWMVSGDITEESNGVLFSGGTTDNAIMSKTKVMDYSDFGVEKCFDFSVTINVSAIAADSEFSLLFGLQRLSSEYLIDSSEIAIHNYNDVLAMTVRKNTQAGKVVLSENITNSSLIPNANIIISGKFEVDGGVTLKLGSDIIFQCADGFNAIGFFRIMQKASALQAINLVQLKSINAVAYVYDNASNPIKVEEKFENNHFNKNAWFLSGQGGYYVPSRNYVKDNSLVFENSRAAYISSVQEYSNFSLEVDIPYMQRAVKYNAAGEILSPITSWIGMAFGTAAFDVGFDEAVLDAVFFQLEPAFDGSSYVETPKSGRYILWERYKPLSANIPFAPGYNLWNEEDVKKDGKDRTINLKFIMQDGVFKHFVKYEDEQWSDTPAFTYNMGYTPKGCVRLMLPGDVAAADTSKGVNSSNVIVKRLQIQNLDQKADDFKINIGYEANGITQKPFEYTEAWNDSDLISTKGKQSNAFMVVNIICICVSALVAGFIVLLVLKIRRKVN